MDFARLIIVAKAQTWFGAMNTLQNFGLIFKSIWLSEIDVIYVYLSLAL